MRRRAREAVPNLRDLISPSSSSLLPVPTSPHSLNRPLQRLTPLPPPTFDHPPPSTRLPSSRSLPSSSSPERPATSQQNRISQTSSSSPQPRRARKRRLPRQILPRPRRETELPTPAFPTSRRRQISVRLSLAPTLPVLVPPRRSSQQVQASSTLSTLQERDRRPARGSSPILLDPPLSLLSQPRRQDFQD